MCCINLDVLSLVSTGKSSCASLLLYVLSTRHLNALSPTHSVQRSTFNTSSPNLLSNSTYCTLHTKRIIDHSKFSILNNPHS